MSPESAYYPSESPWKSLSIKAQERPCEREDWAVDTSCCDLLWDAPSVKLWKTQINEREGRGAAETLITEGLPTHQGGINPWKQPDYKSGADLLPFFFFLQEDEDKFGSD